MTAPAAPSWRVEVHAALPSTQRLLKDRLEAGDDVDGLVVRATEQEAGRGRRGNGWASAAGGSYQSLALLDRWEGGLRHGGITLLLAVELAEWLRAGGAPVMVKWPNDLYLDGGKLAGILTEYVRGHLVVGVGVNVTNPVPLGAASLAELDLAAVHAGVLAAARRAVEATVAAAGDLRLPERLAPLDLLLGRTVTLSVTGGELTGEASGVRRDGALLVKVGDELKAVQDGSVRGWEPR